jgi:hypothetical protein
LLSATRRSFLRLVGSTAALSALAQLRVVPPAAAATEEVRAAGFFDASETEILTQLMERVVDTGLPDAPRVRDTRAVARVDALCATLDGSVTSLLPLLLRAFDYGPILFDLRFARFTRLSDADKDASLAGWMNSRIALRRMAFMALRNLCFLGWYSQEESWPLIGYQGPLLQARSARSEPQGQRPRSEAEPSGGGPPQDVPSGGGPPYNVPSGGGPPPDLSTP